MALENIAGKRKHTEYQHFLLDFGMFFYLLKGKFHELEPTSICHLNAFNVLKPRIRYVFLWYNINITNINISDKNSTTFS